MLKRRVGPEVSIVQLSVVSTQLLSVMRLMHGSTRCFGKGFNESCPIGPVLVRIGQIDPDKLDMKGVLSGETVQQSNTSWVKEMYHKAIQG